MSGERKKRRSKITFNTQFVTTPITNKLDKTFNTSHYVALTSSLGRSLQCGW